MLVVPPPSPRSDDVPGYMRSTSLTPGPCARPCTCGHLYDMPLPYTPNLTDLPHQSVRRSTSNRRKSSVTYAPTLDGNNSQLSRAATEVNFGTKTLSISTAMLYDWSNSTSTSTSKSASSSAKYSRDQDTNRSYSASVKMETFPNPKTEAAANRFRLKPLKTWCNSLTSNGVRVPPSGRRFNRSKNDMTAGEQRIFDAICKNRSATSSGGSSGDETPVTSHQDAWSLERSRPPRLKYSHNDVTSASDHLMPLNIQKMATAGNARNGSSYSYVQSVPCETGAAQGSRNPGNLGRYKPFTPLQRKRTTVHIYLPKLDDDKDEEGVDQSECSNDNDDQSSEDDDLDIVSVANENEAASDDESITRSSSLALSPRAPSTLNSLSLSSMRQYTD